MATKTMILRPSGTGIIDGATRVNGLSLYPTDWDEKNVHNLVNESEADDDGTYVYRTAVSLSPYHVILFDFTPIEDYQSIIDIRVCFRVKAIGDLNTGITFGSYAIKSVTDSGFLNYDTFRNLMDYVRPSESDVWVTFTESVTTDYITELLEQYIPTNEQAFGKPVVAIVPNFSKSTTEGDKSSSSLRLTQFYLEVTYEDASAETIPLYLKKDGIWSAITGTVYNKVDGVWVDGSMDALSDGSKIVVKEI